MKTILEQLHELTGLEYRLIMFYKKIKHLTEFDNNDHPDVIWGDIKSEVDKFENELKG